MGAASVLGAALLLACTCNNELTTVERLKKEATMYEAGVDNVGTMPYVSSNPVSSKGYDDKQSKRTLPQLWLKDGISSGAAARSWQS